jgi:sugar phosphate isomerase/epimerase
MKLNQVAAQLYTLRDFTQTATDLATTLRRVREIGYTAVQISAIGPIPDAEVAAMIDGEGLTCCAIHSPGTKILEETAGVIEQLDALKCRHVAYPHPGNVKLDKLADVKRFAQQLDEAGAKLAAAGKVLSYHNHSLEFRRFSNRPILEWLYKRTDAKHLQGEIDTYWVQHGGGDPVEWCRKLRGRLPLLHMKDYAVGSDNQPRFAEIGNGNLNWKKIVAAADKAGCEWYIVEQDTCPGDPFESLRMSFAFIAKRLVKKDALKPSA